MNLPQADWLSPERSIADPVALAGAQVPYPGLRWQWPRDGQLFQSPQSVRVSPGEQAEEQAEGRPRLGAAEVSEGVFINLITDPINYSHCGDKLLNGGRPSPPSLSPWQMSNSRLRRIRSLDGQVPVAQKVGPQNIFANYIVGRVFFFCSTRREASQNSTGCHTGSSPLLLLPMDGLASGQ